MAQSRRRNASALGKRSARLRGLDASEAPDLREMMEADDFGDKCETPPTGFVPSRPQGAQCPGLRDRVHVARNCRPTLDGWGRN
jgi:hypothetical protein